MILPPLAGMTLPPLAGLYLLTPPSFALARFAPLFAQALAASGARWAQLRLKPAADDAIARAYQALAPLAHARGAALVINDSPALAQACGADGVHVGAEDAPTADARALLGASLHVGASCGDSLARAHKASADGADLVAFGALNPTTTKAVQHRVGLDIYARWRKESATPSVAIGGLDPKTARAALDAGAAMAAVSGWIWQHPQGVEVAGRAMRAAAA